MSHSRRLSLRIAFFMGTFAVLSFSVGCSSDKAATATITGSVQIDGKNANSGDIVFSTKEMTVSGAIQSDGTYKVVGAAPGAAKIYLMSAPKAIAKTSAPALEGTGGKQTVSNPIPIPAKYQKAETSGLTFEIKSGDNSCPLQLSTK